ncbi:MAG: hypothetical protein WBP42_12575 [Candidatus Zixiibacteriota bacterium]
MKHLLIQFARPMTSRELELTLAITGVQVRAIVSYLRVVQHYPIGSDQRGYFWCTSREQLETTIKHMEERGIKDLTVASALKKIFPNPQQERLL